MIRIVRACEVERALFFRAFSEGFSDYLIKLSMGEEEFYGRFFGVEGNEPDRSFIALEADGDGGAESERGVGVILGGIRDFDGARTMRCGAMSVIPERRGTEVAGLLLARHRREAIAEGCGRLFLEVIAGNERAKRFYERNGYAVSGALRYYAHAEPAALAAEASAEGGDAPGVEELGFAELRSYRESLSDLHVNWQNEMDYIERSGGLHYGVRERGELAAALSMQGGSIKFLHVLEGRRGRGLARALIGRGVACALERSPELTAVRSSFPENADLRAFYERLGFSADPLYQFEMSATLPGAAG